MCQKKTAANDLSPFIRQSFISFIIYLYRFTSFVASTKETTPAYSGVIFLNRINS